MTTGRVYVTLCRYYSFKIFLLFRLAQILWLILHNQLALTIFARRLRIIDKKSKDNREALGTRLRRFSCFVKAGKNGGKFHTVYEEEMAELLPKNIARTAKIHVDGWQLRFEGYLQDETSLYILNLPRNR